MYKQIYEAYINKIDTMEKFIKEYKEFEKLKAKMEPTKKKKPSKETEKKIERQRKILKFQEAYKKRTEIRRKKENG